MGNPGKRIETENGLQFARRPADGPNLLLLHPIGLDHHSWDRVADRLVGKYNIVAPDLPGHGGSLKALEGPHGPASLSVAVETLLDRLGWDETLVVGNSLGGGTALSLAKRQPERVKALGLLCSVGYREGLPLIARAAFVPGVPLLAGIAPPPLVRLGLELVRGRWGSVLAEDAIRTSQYLRSRDGRASLLRALRDLYGQDLTDMALHYESVQCPTLILQGRRDPLIRPWHAERLAKTIPGSELILLPRVGHFPQEEDPDTVAQELDRFLSSVSGIDASPRRHGDTEGVEPEERRSR
jgi:pimeloyl-ACP methyl ester carboxylesterase